MPHERGIDRGIRLYMAVCAPICHYSYPAVFFCKSSKDMIFPANALATTVAGFASQVLPGPPLPGKFRFIAEMVTCDASLETPGPHCPHGPQEGLNISAPIYSKAGIYPFSIQYFCTSIVPH
jgi:hypothetical protein